MVTTGHRYHSDFARRFFTEGEAQGKAEGKAEALLATLEARGVHVPADALDEITGCTDVILLETWIRRAVMADKIQDIID